MSAGATAEQAPEHAAAPRWRGIAAIVVSVVSLAAVVVWASGQETPRFPTAAGDLALLALAIGLYGAATVGRGWRWHAILRHAHVGHRAVDAYALVPVGYMGNAVLPARGGELLRIFLLAGRSDARRREVLGSILTERILDAVTLAVLFIALTFAGIAGSPVGERPAVLALAALALGVVALFVYMRLRRRGRFDRFAEVARPVLKASRPLIGPVGVLLGGATLGVWLLEGVIFWLVAQSLALDMSLAEGCSLLVLTAFMSLIPAAPGYVGTFDAAVIFGLKALDVTGGQAVAYALLVRFVLFFPVTIAGLILLVTRYGGLRQLRRRRAATA
ncbi:MAG TPA: lysylphosphatidylglycerol synthase transmembrane domain-containing protein [Solirubrobacteraceae bacterium]|nr:lysylphosphatidylglycerol synthase transmembrane domain-containing protein [Solirubrobacteraceae bacterium]